MTTKEQRAAAAPANNPRDQQGPTPRRQLGQGTAQDKADGRTAARDGAVDAECTGSLSDFGECCREQRQRGRCHDRGEGTLQGPGAEEHGRILGQATQGGGRAEPDEAHDEHAAATEVIGDPPTEKQKAAEGEGVSAQHPLAVGGRDVQGSLGRGQGDDHDRRVEHDHQLGHGDHGQRPPPSRIGLEAR